MSEHGKNLDWSPASKWAASFRSHQLDQSNSSKLEFKPTWGVRAFCFIFKGLGVLASVAFVAGFACGKVPTTAVVVVLIVGGLFGYVSKLLEKIAFTPRVFDRMTETYRSVEYSFRGAGKEIREAISAIVALQVLDKRVSHSNGSYTAYELNLVLDDGRRTNVICHADYASLKQDAQAIASSLGLPIVERGNTE